jgi:four helix bundle protein
MAITTFKDLEVWNRAFEISLIIHKSSLGFPKIEQFELGSQIRRASKSICANLGEGFSKQYESNAEYKRFINIALGSSNEMLVWLEYIEKLGYVEPQKIAGWKEEYSIICRMLKALHISRRKLDDV